MRFIIRNTTSIRGFRCALLAIHTESNCESRWWCDSSSEFDLQRSIPCDSNSMMGQIFIWVNPCHTSVEARCIRSEPYCSSVVAVPGAPSSNIMEGLSPPVEDIQTAIRRWSGGNLSYHSCRVRRICFRTTHEGFSFPPSFGIETWNRKNPNG